jgi:hypothetical protein
MRQISKEIRKALKKFRAFFLDLLFWQI